MKSGIKEYLSLPISFRSLNKKLEMQCLLAYIYIEKFCAKEQERDVMLIFEFNERKTTQAAGFLLKKNEGKMNYTKLIKLLYLADREALRLWERPITGDHYVSMRNGPVLSNVLDLINYGDIPGFTKAYWSKYISKPYNYNVKLLKSLIEDELSEMEKKTLVEIYKKYKRYDQWKMIDITHKLPEWKHPGNTSIPIQVKDIFLALHKTEREIEIIEEEVSNLNHVWNVLDV